MMFKVSFKSVRRYLDLKQLDLVFGRCPRWLRPLLGREDGQEGEWALARDGDSELSLELVIA